MVHRSNERQPVEDRASYVVAAADGDEGRSLVVRILTWANGRGYQAKVFDAVAASKTRAPVPHASLGFTVVGTVPDGLRHPTLGLVGLHVLHRSLTGGST